MILYKVSVGRINSEQVKTILVNYTEFLGCTRLEGRQYFHTPSNSEIICVQNVGAKVEMVSYLKK